MMGNRCGAVLLLAVLSGCTLFARDEPVVGPPSTELMTQIESTVLVLLRDELSDEDVRARAADFAERGHGAVVAVYTDVVKGFALNMPLERAQSIAKDDASIISVEPDGLATAQAVSCRRSSVSGEEIPWGVKRIGGPPVPDISAKRIWVLDTGIDLGNRDLNIEASPSLAANFVGSLACQPGGSVADQQGHGTHVAGIAAAKTNGSGLRGAASGATVVPVRISADGNVAFSIVLCALDWVGRKGLRREVVNLSFTGPPSAMVNAATRALADRELSVAVAAGNQGESALLHSPAMAGGYTAANGARVITTSAIDNRDRYWSGSNFGDRPPDFAEPGVRIKSYWLGGAIKECTGTSMAAPHMAGIMARGIPKSGGNVLNDPDGQPDPIGVCCGP